MNRKEILFETWKDISKFDTKEEIEKYFSEEIKCIEKVEQIRKIAIKRSEKYHDPNECGMSIECNVCMAFYDILDSIYVIESEVKFKKYYEIYKERFDYNKFHKICGEEFSEIWRVRENDTSKESKESKDNYLKIKQKLIDEIYPEFQEL